MILLICKLCSGEVDIIANFRAINKKIKCRKCGFSNESEAVKGPEVLVMRRRPILD